MTEFCNRTRREFLWETGAGFTGLALTGMLSMDGFFAKKAEASPDVKQAKADYVNPLATKNSMFPSDTSARPCPCRSPISRRRSRLLAY